MGRFRGDLITKIHAVVDAEGQAHVAQFPRAYVTGITLSFDANYSTEAHREATSTTR